MPIAFLAICVGALFLTAYYIYGKRIGRFFSLTDRNRTPAVEFEDGVDFVPTSKPILLAQHFASIAAAGPVVGPIAAAMAFGWGPTLLWIVLGCIFIGACHDLSSLVASVRHGAKSLPEIAKSQLGLMGYRLSLGFVWMCLLYVIIVFTDVTAQQFVAKEEWGGVLHDIGGGVATSSLLYLLLSVGLGVGLTKFKCPLWLGTVIFFPLLVGIIILGQKLPITFEFSNPVMIWGVLIILYCALASVLPMWLLLQPRGYLGGYFLYTILLVGLFGLLFGSFSIEYPMVKHWFSASGDSLYPFLFITVACGACSGFHGLVCSGTTSKQLRKESHAPLIGYGGMLLEGVVAVMALSTVMIWPVGSAVFSKSPSEIYATGIAHFSHKIFGLGIGWGMTFGMLAFATFVYDTLDVATRLGRYLMEELFQLKGWSGRVIATAITLGLPLLYVLMAPELTRGGKRLPLWQVIWPLFGSSNQLLAALTLLLLTVWLWGKKQWPAWVFIPALFMFVTSSLALVIQMKQACFQLGTEFSLPALLNLIISSLLILVSIGFGVACVRAVGARDFGKRVHGANSVKN